MAGEATRAQAITELKSAIDLQNEIDLFANANTPNFIGLHNTHRDNAVYIESGSGLDGIESSKSDLNTILSPSRGEAIIRGALLNYFKAAGILSRSFGMSALRDLYDDLEAQSDTFNSRNFTFGSVSAGTNTGDGTIHRLTVNEDDYDLEMTHSEAKAATCISDTRSGANVHEEVFLIEGEEQEDSDNPWVDVQGSGISTRLTAVSARNTRQLLTNPSFSRLSGGTPSTGSPATPSTTTSITGWTINSSTANFELDVDTTYRGFKGDTTPTSVRFKGNDKLTQTLSDEKDPSLSRTQPYFCQVAVYREGSCDGTFTVRMGATTEATTVTTLTNSAWNIITVTFDKGLYYKNFREDGMTFELELSSRTTGTLYVDDIIWVPWTAIDGNYYVAVGAQTPFLEDDSFSWTDTEGGTRAKIMYWLWRILQPPEPFTFPIDNAGTETISDP